MVRSIPPGAEVHSLGDKGERGASLGVTPVNLTLDGPRSLEISKSGFLSTSVFVPSSGSGENLGLTVNLQAVSRESLEKLVKEKHPDILDDTAYDLLELQRAASSGREAEVGALVRRSEGRYANFLTFNIILGNFYFARKDFGKAREYYDRALVIDPENKDARSMIKLLGASRR